MIKLSYEHENNILRLKSRFDSLEISNHDQKNPSLRSSHSRCFVRKGVLRNFARKTSVPSQFFNKLFFIKKEALTQVFSGEFCEISKNTFFTERLQKTASLFYNEAICFVLI